MKDQRRGCHPRNAKLRPWPPKAGRRSRRCHRRRKPARLLLRRCRSVIGQPLAGDSGGMQRLSVDMIGAAAKLASSSAKFRFRCQAPREIRRPDNRSRSSSSKSTATAYPGGQGARNAPSLPPGQRKGTGQQSLPLPLRPAPAGTEKLFGQLRPILQQQVHQARFESPGWPVASARRWRKRWAWAARCASARASFPADGRRPQHCAAALRPDPRRDCIWRDRSASSSASNCPARWPFPPSQSASRLSYWSCSASPALRSPALPPRCARRRPGVGQGIQHRPVEKALQYPDQRQEIDDLKGESGPVDLHDRPYLADIREADCGRG